MLTNMHDFERSLEKMAIDNNVFEKKSFSDKEVRNSKKNECRFVECDFNNITFLNCFFDSLVFERCHFTSVNFISCKAKNIRFTDCHFQKIDVASCSFSELNLHKCIIQEIKFQAGFVEYCSLLSVEINSIQLAQLKCSHWCATHSFVAGMQVSDGIFNDASWVDCRLKAVSFNGVKISRWIMATSSVDKFLFEDITGEGYVWYKCTLHNAVLSGLNLRAASFHLSRGEHCSIEQSCLVSSILIGTIFNDSSFSGSDLSNCQAEKAAFTRCNFQQSYLIKSFFTDALFDECLMAECSLQKVTLWNADLSSTPLTDAHVSDVYIHGAVRYEGETGGEAEEPLATIIDEWYACYHPGKETEKNNKKVNNYVNS